MLDDGRTMTCLHIIARDADGRAGFHLPQKSKLKIKTIRIQWRDNFHLLYRDFTHPSNKYNIVQLIDQFIYHSNILYQYSN